MSIEAIDQQLKQLGISYTFKSHQAVTSFQHWVEVASDFDAKPTKTVVAKPSKGPNENPIIVISLESSKYSITKLAKFLGNKDARVAPEELVKSTLGVERINATPFLLDKLVDKNSVTVVLDQKMVDQDILLAFRAHSDEKSLLISSGCMIKYLDSHAIEYKVIDFDNIDTPVQATAQKQKKSNDTSVKEKEIIIGLTVKKEENFPKWYEQVLVISY
jgi:prolyl-tRNA synthetase